jgi:hypothetical protein
MYIKVMQVGLNIGDGYQDYAGKALELKLISGVIHVRFKTLVDVKVMHVRWTSGLCKMDL